MSDQRIDSCERKIAFANEKGARDELASIIQRAMHGERQREHLESGVYHCNACGKWHLTSRPWDDQVVNGGKQDA